MTLRIPARARTVMGKCRNVPVRRHEVVEPEGVVDVVGPEGVVEVVGPEGVLEVVGLEIVIEMGGLEGGGHGGE